MTSLGGETHYYVRAYAINSVGTSYGGQVEFDTLEQSPTVVLNIPADTATGISTTPTLEFTGTDPGGDDVRYNVQVATDNDFSSLFVTDSYDSSNSSTIFSVDADPNMIGQTFVPTISGYLSRITFFMRKIGTPTGNVTAKLYSMDQGSHGSTGKPANGATALAISTTNLDITILTGIDTLYNFDFSANYFLDSSSTYVVMLDATTATLDTSNNIKFHMDQSSPSHAGNQVYSGNGGSTWNATNANDSIFYVYINTVILDVLSSTDPGFANTVTGGDIDPFNSGEKADYDVQAGDTLDNSTTYYWRVRGIDPTPGSNTYGDWSATRSFITEAGGASSIKKLSSISQASLKKISGIANTSTKKVSGITNV
jgi:hypothetical protein